MEIYRIVSRKYAQDLFASGNAGRWNLRNQKVLYASASRSLACLENMVHRGQKMFSSLFTVMVIEVPDDIIPQKINKDDLISNWYHSDKNGYRYCQNMGQEWYVSQQSSLLMVPSAVMYEEYNYVINTRHQDMDRIKLLRRENISIDERLNAMNNY